MTISITSATAHRRRRSEEVSGVEDIHTCKHRSFFSQLSCVWPEAVLIIRSFFNILNVKMAPKRRLCRTKGSRLELEGAAPDASSV